MPAGYIAMRGEIALLTFAGGLALVATADPQTATTETAPTRLESSALDRTDAGRAQLFGLTAEEWRRYRMLMRGPRGLWTPALDPLWVLGVHAETDAARRRYAELAARREHERVEAELAFARAYDEAFARLYPGEQAMAPAHTPALGSRDQPPVLQPGERLLFFTRLDCAACEPWLQALLARLSSLGVGLDIYLLDAASDEAIRAWAKQQKIPPEAVNRRVITLNHDQGLLAKLAPQAQPPVLMSRRGEALHPLSLLELLASQASAPRPGSVSLSP